MIEPTTLFVLPLGLCVIGAGFMIIVPRKRRAAVFVASVTVACLAALAAALPVLAGGPDVAITLWRLPAGGALRLAVNPLSALFVIVTSLVFLISIPGMTRHAATYSNGLRAGLFCALYLLLFAAVALVLAADDVVSFLVSWEVMSLLLYALIAFDHDSEPADRPAYLMLAMGEAGMISGAAGLLLLAAPAAGLDFAALRAAAPALGEGATWAVFLLTFFGFGVKAGLVPVNQWLPDAYTFAPRGFRPVLAGATTNLGIYAIARIDLDLLSPTIAGPGLVALAAGSLTALIGILYATTQPDMRRMLAHSSIENMGIIAAALGAGLVFAATGHDAIAAMAFVAALYHMTNHSFYKALLFTGAGHVEEAAATSDMDRLGGLLRRMPATGFLFFIGIFAIAALPPLNGFVSEWLTLETMLRAAVLSSTASKVVFALSGAVLALTAGLAVTCFVKAFAMSFLGVCRSRRAATAGEASRWARGPMAAFAMACVLLGVLPTYAIPVFDRAVSPLVSASAVEALVPPFFGAGAAAETPLPRAFRSEFHDLGAEIGKDVLPGRGLVVLHRGGEKNPVVFAMSTTYMAAVLVIALALAYGAFRLLTRRRTVVSVAVWDGGLRRLRPEYTYTATGFSNLVRVVFHALLRPRMTEDSTAAVARHFRTAIRRVVVERHPTERLFLNPLVAAVRGVANVLRGMHHGHVNVYTAYVLAALLLSLILGLGLAA